MIWDVHCHLSGVSGRTPIERMAQLLEFADRMGVERLCMSMGMSWSHHPTPEKLQQENDEVLEAIAHWSDRAFGFCYVSGEHVEASLREIDRCIADGPMVGVKLWVARRCSHEAIDAIVARAAELKAVILQHTWFKTNEENRPGESTPDDLAALAGRHPDVPIICGHTGGTWELGIRATRASKNLYCDLAGSDPTNGFVEMAVREVGAGRVLFGSDIGGRSFASQLAKVQGARIPDAARRMILRDNLHRLLLPILRAKGIRA